MRTIVFKRVDVSPTCTHSQSDVPVVSPADPRLNCPPVVFKAFIIGQALETGRMDTVVWSTPVDEITRDAQWLKKESVLIGLKTRVAVTLVFPVPVFPVS